ncbi:MAG: flagellar basal body L-ring protein FlgH, partial [Planctomycetes bacterium]|nr:flagellar basal body L-ring protein FlgH [Planctomycetota bacterium]
SIDNSHNGTEGTEQKERLTGKITATIVEQNPGGLLRIEGERIVEVNGEENLMRLSGLVRSKDIRSDNSLYSYNVADANITYRKTGLVNKMAKPGKIQRLGTWLLGTGLIIAAITQAS